MNLNQVCVSPHCATDVRRCLDEVDSDRWIRERGSIEWFSKSPEHNPSDFFTRSSKICHYQNWARQYRREKEMNILN